jgi:hypothetical protein
MKIQKMVLRKIQKMDQIQVLQKTVAGKNINICFLYGMVKIVVLQ